ncbi:hypothetical protein NEILACOT_03538 [Neisseria lactamica ATCC 23970]|uniref:Uncharacterized protein n=1 Tax=Neisseria lactamica ATCC 23970 TaxID=546265 RepID=D0W7N8_NEILA|nr:hypothetical protein NEILACOT_03538 [Neisseria lactamica ATCC 23970]
MIIHIQPVYQSNHKTQPFKKQTDCRQSGRYPVSSNLFNILIKKRFYRIH